MGKTEDSFEGRIMNNNKTDVTRRSNLNENWEGLDHNKLKFKGGKQQGGLGSEQLALTWFEPLRTQRVFHEQQFWISDSIANPR
jgi:hypothetical protein